MLASRTEASTRPGTIDVAADFGPLNDRELVETTGGGWLLVALIIIGAAAVGVVVGTAAYVLSH